MINYFILGLSLAIVIASVVQYFNQRKKIELAEKMMLAAVLGDREAFLKGITAKIVENVIIKIDYDILADLIFLKAKKDGGDDNGYKM